MDVDWPARHHGFQRGAVLGERQGRGAGRRPRVRAASDVDVACAQLGVGIYVRAGLEWLTLTRNFVHAYPAIISLVSQDTSSVLPKAERVARSTTQVLDRTQRKKFR
jgi:hypothetical protein